MNYCPKCGLPEPMSYVGISCKCEETITTNSTTMTIQYYIFTPDGKEVRVIEGKDVPTPVESNGYTDDKGAGEYVAAANQEALVAALSTKSVRVENASEVVGKFGDILWFPINLISRSTEMEVNHLYPLEADRWRVEYSHSAVLGEKTDLGYKLTGSERTATILPVSKPTEQDHDLRLRADVIMQEYPFIKNEREKELAYQVASHVLRSQPVVTGEVSEDELWDRHDEYFFGKKLDRRSSEWKERKSKYTITPKE